MTARLHARAQGVAEVLSRRRLHLASRPQAKLPRQLPATNAELGYARGIVEMVVAPLRHAVRGVDQELMRIAAGARRDGPVDEAHRLVEAAVGKVVDGLDTRRVDALARQYARAASDHQREQFRRQIRAGLGVDLVRAEPFLEPLIDAHVADNVALIKSIPTEAAARIEKLVTRSVREGSRAEDLAAELEDEVGFAEDRALLIARDQIGKLTGQVNRARQEDLGLDAYFWRGVLDERERPEHLEREGERFTWDDPPEDGQPGFPIRCRCWAEPDLSGLLDELDGGDRADSGEDAYNEDKTRAQHAARPQRESLSKRLGSVADAIRARDGYACVYCRADEVSEARAGRALHLDHVRPESAGGRDTAKNLVLACHRCNSVRHDMTLDEWAKYSREHLDVSVDPARVRAQAAKRLPGKAAEQQAAAENHARHAAAHSAEAEIAAAPEGREAHQAAATAHEFAAERGRAGRLTMPDRQEARKATKAAHELTRGAGGEEPRDERGRWTSK